MKEPLAAFLSGTPLFEGIAEEDVSGLLRCLDAREKRFEKGDVIYRMGETVAYLGLIVSGGVTIETDDAWGRQSILGHAEAGQLFAETYACIPGERMLVNAVASEQSRILFLNISRLTGPCPSPCPHHNRLIQNLLRISAQKNLALSRRILHTSPKTIRERLLSYLSEQAKRNGANRFAIPFNRQQLADYLSVDRSALSNELSKMRDEGLLSWRKNAFVLHSIQSDQP